MSSGHPVTGFSVFTYTRPNLERCFSEAPILFGPRSLRFEASLLYTKVHHDKKTTRGGTKRASDETADGLAKRRAAFGDITNAFAQQLQGKEKAKKVAKLEKAVKVLPRRRSGRLASKPSKIARPVLPGDESMSSQGSVSSQESLPSSQSSVSPNSSDSCSSDGSRPVSPVLSVQDLNEKNRQKTEEAIAAEGKVQENFELNHETLYQAVKIVDHYLAKTKVTKEKLQLVGATALFMSCKFDK
uniref:Cyclin N-terminal domain-containing protein n=1 Tax=Branchiostoma floridae TaxID=7739 RepID=C3ZE12_BRAFL|eukprot:XP_002592957.1 hypothetical protein BRAFLDRAFT_117769 [Branchiostoma floridae]